MVISLSDFLLLVDTKFDLSTLIQCKQ
jgi:hypothetical protein